MSIDMSQFIAAKSDQLNADDLMDSPRTITVTRVSASPDAAEQPVSIHFEGDQGKPFKPCKTMRRILVGVWGKDASKYVGRSMTLYRDPTVAFGGLQVGGIRISHMSDIAEDKTVALLVTRGRKAPFKIKPLVDAPRQQSPDFSGKLAELQALAKPGNMDALGAAWKEIGADARKALAAELPALKAACEEPEPSEDMPFDGAAEDEQPPQVNDEGFNMAEEIEKGADEHPGKAVADAIIAEINAPECNVVMDVARVLDRHANDLQALSDVDAVRVEVAADKRRQAIRAEQTAGAK